MVMEKALLVHGREARWPRRSACRLPILPVILQPAKVATPLVGGERVGGAGEGARRPAGADGEGDRGGRVGDHVARLVLDAHRRLGAPGRPVDPAAGLGGEDQLGGRAEGDGEGVAGDRS